MRTCLETFLCVSQLQQHQRSHLPVGAFPENRSSWLRTSVCPIRQCTTHYSRPLQCGQIQSQLIRLYYSVAPSQSSSHSTHVGASEGHFGSQLKQAKIWIQQHRICPVHIGCYNTHNLSALENGSISVWCHNVASSKVLANRAFGDECTGKYNFSGRVLRVNRVGWLVHSVQCTMVGVWCKSGWCLVWCAPTTP